MFFHANHPLDCPSLLGGDLIGSNVTAALTSRARALIRIAVFISSQNFDAFDDSVSEAVKAGLTREEIEEVIHHLSIYVGFPKALQSFKRMKGLGIAYSGKKIDEEVEGQFNFFVQPEIQQALQSIHPDFAKIAGTNAATLCARGGLSPLERALIILASDVVQNVFDGPYQIHIRMVLESRGNKEMIAELLEVLRPGVPGKNIFKAWKILETGGVA
jgi:alkylhydroperoxidase/carboxymuconolactone decarboxylase family protein YurZ